MDLYQLGVMILTAYAMIAGIVLITDLLMEYVQQRHNEMNRYHSKPTIMTVLRTIPAHLKNAFLWPAEIKNIF